MALLGRLPVISIPHGSHLQVAVLNPPGYLSEAMAATSLRSPKSMTVQLGLLPAASIQVVWGSQVAVRNLLGYLSAAMTAARSPPQRNMMDPPGLLVVISTPFDVLMVDAVLNLPGLHLVESAAL